MLSCKLGVIKVNLNGGLGNQLFQFATATTCALLENRQLQFVESNKVWKNRLTFLDVALGKIYEPKIRGNKLDLVPSTHRSFCKFESFHEKQFNYSKIRLSKSHTSIHGYFQSEKYFKEYKNEIRAFIKYKVEQLGFMSQASSIVQIRLGDMARNREIREVHGIITDDYLKKAMSLFALDEKPWHLVSDDIQLISHELPIFSNLQINKIAVVSDLEDFYNLTHAKNLIISNSTFGWWGAWLSDAKVVAPTGWFSPHGLKQRPTIDLFRKAGI
jgi:hypothetical protein